MSDTSVNLLVDGISFQLDNTGVARIWRTLLPQLATRLKSVTLLDRGNSPDVAGIRRIPFPAYTGTATAAESILIEKLCAHYRADVFTSTHYSTPLCTPMLLLICDAELNEDNPSARRCQEKELAILYSKRRVCFSEKTRRELLTCYPELNPATISVLSRGAETKFFRQRSQRDVKTLADHLTTTFTELVEESRSGAHDGFFRRWSELRRIQADVDF